MTSRTLTWLTMTLPAGALPAVRGTASVAEFAEDFAEPVVYCLEDGRAVGEIGVVERGEPGDGRVDPLVPGGSGRLVPGGARPRVRGRIERLWVHRSLLLRLQLTSAGPVMRYSPA
jgi:hypothetical protein